MRCLFVPALVHWSVRLSVASHPIPVYVRRRWQWFSWGSSNIWTRTRTYCHFQQVHWGNKLKHCSSIHLELPILACQALLHFSHGDLSGRMNEDCWQPSKYGIGMAFGMDGKYNFVIEVIFCKLHLYIGGRVAQQLYLGFAFTASDDWQWLRAYKEKTTWTIQSTSRPATLWHLLLSYIYAVNTT